MDEGMGVMGEPLLLYLPTEVHLLILSYLNDLQMTRICRVCTQLCKVAQPVLFTHVVIKTPKAAESLVCARGLQLSPSTGRLLATYTRSISLEDSYVYPGRSASHRATHRGQLLELLAACEEGNLEDLRIILNESDDIYAELGYHLKLAGMLKKLDICCSRVYLWGCDWYLVAPVLCAMGRSLTSLLWRGGKHVLKDDWNKNIELLYLPLLEEVNFGDMEPSVFKDAWLPNILEGAASTLRSLSLELHSDTDLDMLDMEWTLLGCRFPNLDYFRCCNLPKQFCQ
ncbi:hypothetical protein P389DRAFT_8660 [Cystobasidium minutum MCA 4210]|uniref:uncharacterized protein n=1 Tax=Cystobasidium minutum MCA 4210 TaxID=1397322 RepID=UPI0034CDBCEF|eukprot:jgi/Rhomi1/8660/CE8659_293